MSDCRLRPPVRETARLPFPANAPAAPVDRLPVKIARRRRPAHHPLSRPGTSAPCQSSCSPAQPPFMAPFGRGCARVTPGGAVPRRWRRGRTWTRRPRTGARPSSWPATRPAPPRVVHTPAPRASRRETHAPAAGGMAEPRALPRPASCPCTHPSAGPACEAEGCARRLDPVQGEACRAAVLAR